MRIVNKDKKTSDISREKELISFCGFWQRPQNQRKKETVKVESITIFYSVFQKCYRICCLITSERLEIQKATRRQLMYFEHPLQIRCLTQFLASFCVDWIIMRTYLKLNKCQTLKQGDIISFNSRNTMHT